MELKAGKISHLHHDVIWLLRPKSFRILLSRVIYTSPELPNLNMKGKTKRILVVVVKWRFRARVLYSTKVWRHKNEISQIMGFVRIFWKNNVQEDCLLKMSISGQIVSEIVAQLCLENSIQTLLNPFTLVLYWLEFVGSLRGSTVKYCNYFITTFSSVTCNTIVYQPFQKTR